MGVVVTVGEGVAVCVGVVVGVGLIAVIQFLTNCTPPYPFEIHNSVPSCDIDTCFDG